MSLNGTIDMVSDAGITGMDEITSAAIDYCQHQILEPKLSPSLQRNMMEQQTYELTIGLCVKDTCTYGMVELEVVERCSYYRTTLPEKHMIFIPRK